MPSPFPGMNPYLEQDDVWEDFHRRFCLHCAESLSPQVRPGYIVKLESHIYVHEADSTERRPAGRADVGVARPKTALSTPAAAAVLEAPTYGLVAESLDVERQAYVEVRDRRNRELIAVIELLSPTNKRRGPDREQYLAKRREVLLSPVHLVEIDLLRGGPRLPVEDVAASEYRVLVSRAQDRPRIGAWPIALRQRLPIVPVPLREEEPAARLDLQELLHGVYDLAGYADYIYEGAPQPALSADDAAWAAGLTREQ